MRIGLDLDNTIICYDRLFHVVALERNLIAAEVAPTKSAVRANVRRLHGNETWTDLQALIYGPRLCEAEAFPGALDFVARCRSVGVKVCIISHKTGTPERGVPYDLRTAALHWLAQRHWFDTAAGGLSPLDVEFHDTRLAKIEAIRRRGCDYYVDDLPEVFSEAAFPCQTHAILFDPAHSQPAAPKWTNVSSWPEVGDAVFATIPA